MEAFKALVGILLILAFIILVLLWITGQKETDDTIEDSSETNDIHKNLDYE